MGARVRRIRVGKTSGRVQTSKTNWLIVLAPYFFPFYAILFLVLFFLAHLVWNLTSWFWLMFFLVGLGWSFHVTFTLLVLFSVAQPDIQSQGYLFSTVMIYLMNLLTVLLAATALFPNLRFADLGADLWYYSALCYRWTLDNLLALWQHFAHAIRR